MDTLKTAGTYICAKPDQTHAEIIVDFCKEFNIKNHLNVQDLHTTLIYSTGVAVSESVVANDPCYTAKPLKLSIWTSGGSNILVMVFDSDDLCNRHTSARETHGFTHDFPDYTPHMSLSYDVDECLWLDLDLLEEELRRRLPAVVFNAEHQCEIKEDW